VHANCDANFATTEAVCISPDYRARSFQLSLLTYLDCPRGSGRWRNHCWEQR